MAILIFLGSSLLNVQELSFGEFKSYFPNRDLPLIFDNYSDKNGEIIPSELALTFICKGDSSLLTFENIGINQETQEVVYKEVKPYNYNGYFYF